MRKVFVILILVAIVIFSGCTKKEQPVGNEEKPVVAKKEETNVSAPTTEEKIPKLSPLMQVSAGKDPDLSEYSGKLYIAYERFTGETDDIHVSTYTSGKISKPEKVVETNLNDLAPSLQEYSGNLYLFWTQDTPPRGRYADVQFKFLSGNIWSAKQRADELDSFFYYHNQSGIVFNKKLLMFWTSGRPGERGKIGTQYYTGEGWFIGIPVSIENVNEKDAKVTISDNTVHIIYESYAPNANSNEIYYKSYTDKGFWTGGVKLSEDLQTDFKSVGDIVSFNGKLYALWVADGDIYLSILEGARWNAPIKLTSDSIPQGEPVIEEFNGELYVAYSQMEENNAPFVYLANLEV